MRRTQIEKDRHEGNALQSETDTLKGGERQTGRQAGKQAGRQTDRQIERQTETGRQTDRDRQTEKQNLC